MDNRVLELLFQPHQITHQDLPMIQRAIKKYPFVQSIRALYLLGISLYEQQKYAATLADTAAFTTDKKILYHLVNGRKYTAYRSEHGRKQETSPSSDEPLTGRTNQDDEGHSLQVSTPDHSTAVVDEVLANEVNNDALLIPKEKDAVSSLPEKTPGEDQFSHFEQEDGGDILPEETTEIESRKASSTTVTDEVHASKEVTQEQFGSDQIDFHQTPMDGFVHRAVVHAENFVPENKDSIDKHEQERRRLIEEVERKISEKRRSQNEFPPAEEASDDEGFEINFSQAEMALSDEEIPQEAPEKDPLAIASTKWEPMRIEDDASVFRNKNVTCEDRYPLSKTSEQTQDQHATAALPASEQQAYMPVKAQSHAEENQSNVTRFVSTWQNWLKIDRNASVKTYTSPKRAKTEDRKTSVIDKFIETAPKISPLKKEEVSAPLIKERKEDDIRHLMTETLAHIYVEQRLYVRAIDAYQALIEKHPSKKEGYEKMIEEIKRLKNAHLSQ